MSEAQMDSEAPETTSAEEKFFGVRTQIGKKQSEPDTDIELEIVDDRNEEDRRPPRTEASDSSDDDDDEEDDSCDKKKNIWLKKKSVHELV